MRVLSQSRRQSEAAFRPSQARIRKSSCNNGSKMLTWCPTEVTILEFANPYESIDYEDIWYSRDELRSIRRSNEFTVITHSAHEDWRKGESQDRTMRGLETWTDEGSWQRFEHYRDCINKVLDEQDLQRGIDKTEFQNSVFPLLKRINHMHIPFDHDRLAALCRDATARARRLALTRGRRDFLELKEEQAETPVSKAQPEQDNETIQTEVSTDTSSNNDESSADESTPPFAVAASHTTPESLREKQKTRYAIYLVNRQQRIEAREKADFEWEQRRLARRAMIRQETDELVAQMHRIICRTQELIDIVSTKRT